MRRMPVSIAAGIGLFILSATVGAQTPAPPLPGTWQMELEDTFSGSALDGSKWRLGQHWPGLTGSAGMAPENVTVADGRLKIKAEARPVTYSGVAKSYASGEVSTFFQFRQQYGYYEARIKSPAVTGLWPAFWLMPDRGSYGWKEVYYRSYLKFDLTGATPGAVDTAELKVKVSAVESGGSNNVLFMRLHNDAWSESTLTWNNAPAPDPAWIAQRWNQAAAGQEMTIDVKDFVVQQMAGDKVVSFVLADTFLRTKNIKFHSSEAANQADRPRLVINGATYYATEDAYVRWGTLANNNYGNAAELAVEDDWGDTASTYNGGMEVDIMETLGIWGPDVTSHAIHWDGYGADHQVAGFGKTYFPPSADGFHTYGLYWGPGKLEFYVDGIKTAEWSNSRVMSVAAYLILSLQVGGWDGNNPGPQIDGQVMEVDWVRVWSGTPSAPTTLIVDNANSGSVTTQGAWTVANGLSGFYGPNYHHDENSAKGTKAFRFLPALTGNGDYLVYGRWSAAANRASNVPIAITDAKGNVWPVLANQRINGGAWNMLGGYSLAAANAEVAIRNDETDGYVIADAVKLIPSAGDAAALIVDNASTTSTSVTGAWTLSTTTGGYHGSNYAHDGNTAKGTKTFSFKPALSATGDYLVYGRWTSGTNRASNVPIDIIQADGTVDTILIDQRIGGSAWVLLGGWTFSPSTAEIRIRTTGTNGYVIADAIKLIPSEAAVPSTVIVDNSDAGVTVTGAWTASSATGGFQGSNYLHDANTDKGSKSVRFPADLATGSYEVYARWTSDTNRADNVPIDIVSAAGTDAVQVNQKAGGGSWVSLGTYSFTEGNFGSVTIGTAGTNGYVIADAVKFVRQP